MEIFLKFKTGDELEIPIEQDLVTVGRSKDCEVILNSPNISRKHLQIRKDGNELFIQDISSSNWVSFNGDKLSKEKETEYFDFVELMLPDDIYLKIKIEINTDPLPEPDPEITNKRMRPRRSGATRKGQKANTRKGRYRKTAEERQFQIKLVLGGVALIGSIFYFVQNKETIKPKKFGKEKKKARKKNNLNLKKLNYDKMKEVKISSNERLDKFIEKKLKDRSKNFCFERSDQKLCKQIFSEKRWRGGEGLYVDGKMLIMALKISRYELEDVNSNKNQQLFQIHVLSHLLRTDIYKTLNSLKLNDVFIKVLDDKSKTQGVAHIANFKKIKITAREYKTYSTEFKKYGNIKDYRRRYKKYLFFKKFP